MNPGSPLHLLAALLAAPLLGGIIARIKAIAAGRHGAPLRQPYFDLMRLARKGEVRGKGTTILFVAGTLVTLAGALLAIALTPLGRFPALLSFPGDVIAALSVLGLGRFFTIVAAMDTGSSFEGLGASREAFFSALAEPATFIVFAALARATGTVSLSGLLAGLPPAMWHSQAPALFLAAAALLILLLAENSRIPFDDPTTHLELTMIHEVMVLDHSGPGLATVLYGAALKLWLFTSWLAALLVPKTASPWIGTLWTVGTILGVTVLVGITESTMARLRLLRVPQLLLSAAALASVAFLLVL